MQRRLRLFPAQGPSAQDQPKNDAADRKQLREAPIEHGCLTFSSARAAAAETETKTGAEEERVLQAVG